MDSRRLKEKAMEVSQHGCLLLRHLPLSTGRDKVLLSAPLLVVLTSCVQLHHVKYPSCCDNPFENYFLLTITPVFEITINASSLNIYS